MIKTFKGLLADGGQDRIRLQTIKGKVGYRIVKFAGFPNLPGTQNQESTMQIFKVEQSLVSTSLATVDFSDGNLLAALYYAESSSIDFNQVAPIVIFDQEIFNQDIFITHTDTVATQSMNYYIELEVISLTDQGAEYTTIKDLRSNA